ncbi:MAG: ExbD/TolR family protein [Desulfohalobiaceae bacterium]|nr:ExbD/TolR family protein [Desulfohalobiaceae bacterium]
MKFDPHSKGFISQINVTPFVDVMLVLLIIFMITAPMLTQGVEVDLPETETVRTLPEDRDTLVLTVKKDKKLLLDEYELELSELGAYLQKIVPDKNQILYLKADKEVPYGFVVRVMSGIKSAGLQRLGIVAEPEEES